MFVFLYKFKSKYFKLANFYIPFDTSFKPLSLI